MWTSTDGVAWTKAIDVSGPLSAVASAAAPSVFGQGNEAASAADGSWSVIARPESDASTVPVLFLNGSVAIAPTLAGALGTQRGRAGGRHGSALNSPTRVSPSAQPSSRM